MKQKTVLIIDGGGRGAALVDAYARSPQVAKILVIPGNDLMALNSSKPVETYPQIPSSDVPKILALCQASQVDVVDVVRSSAVAAGVVDALVKEGMAVVGPTQAAGQIEWDKAWSREFMVRHQIPSPQYTICHSEAEGLAFIQQQAATQWFVKAAGLAAGKGVIPATTKVEAAKAIQEMSNFGQSGETYLLEDWLVGEEFSAFALTDGTNFQIVGYAQDHKRALNFEMGRNTGGMGAVSNPLVVTEAVAAQVAVIFQQTIDGLRQENRPYRGVLYLGGMLVGEKVYVIEFNARWGDPEAQVILPGLKTDFFAISQAIASDQLHQLHLERDEKVRVAVAGAARGYPGDSTPALNQRIFGLEAVTAMADVKIYGAGVKKVADTYVSQSGRLFYIVGEGADVREARQKAYAALALIHVNGNNLHYRTDIGWRDVQRLQTLLM